MKKRPAGGSGIQQPLPHAKKTRKRPAAAKNLPGSAVHQRQSGVVNHHVSTLGLLEELRLQSVDCWAHSSGFLGGADLLAVLGSNAAAHCLGNQRSGLWSGVGRQFVVHNSILDAGFGCKGLRQLALWSLRSGACSLPGSLAAAFAAEALQDFKMSGWGRVNSNGNARNMVLDIVASPEFAKSFTICRRSLNWNGERASDEDASAVNGNAIDGTHEVFEACGGDDTSVQTDWGPNVNIEQHLIDLRPGFKTLAEEEHFKGGFGEMEQNVAVGFRLGGCEVLLLASYESEVFSGSQASFHGGKLFVRCVPNGPVQKLLQWSVNSGDSASGDADEDNKFILDDAVVTSVLRTLFAGGTREQQNIFSTVEVLQFLWRMLGAPFRWHTLYDPYAEQPSFYLLLRDVFIHFANSTEEDGADDYEHSADDYDHSVFADALFTSEPLRARDSDFLHEKVFLT